MPSKMDLFGSYSVKDVKPASVITLYHGSQEKSITPVYGLGRDSHEYGKGFYLTPDVELAKEWSAGNTSLSVGDCWVHTFELDTSQLEVFDFEKSDVLCWMAELLKYRKPYQEEDYKYLVERLISKYGLVTSGYDVLCGWRADDSHFRIVTDFFRSTIYLEDLQTLLQLGDFGTQYCLKSKEAFRYLRWKAVERVPQYSYLDKYRQRDRIVRQLFDNFESPYDYSGGGHKCWKLLG